MKRTILYALFLLFAAVGALNAADIRVHGTVVSKTDSEPLIGASVVCNATGPSNGVATDIDGEFTLTVPEGSTLTITYIGYKPATVAATPEVFVELEEDTSVLDEVVVVGYQTMKKADLNPDTLSMAVSLNPGGKFTKDHSTHPIYRGLTVTSNDRCKLIAFKDPGWTEDHNCLFFNLPSVLTGLGNQEEACYNTLTQVYGIYPLGTWDSQIDFVSQLNVWEAQQGNTKFKGTILCIGNGGCEFSMKNPDGTPDVSARPKNNPCQENVLTLAKNSLEYLKTR
ncbi:MAG: carboxypeptidase-like regulatory domain-containing protein [Clostridium sp.]|nr:carboxypeptidase-like regulatory domain-containing protein [Clostridium sp.]